MWRLHLKVTDLLLEFDRWTGFSWHFKHLKSGEAVEDEHLLLTAVLADAINLGLSKMAESFNAQFRQPLFSAYWGNGTTSSTDGQNFKAGGRGQFAGQENLNYGQELGGQLYTHISDQYAPFHTKVINAKVCDATHVLYDLLHHESDLCIDEHYTDNSRLHRPRVRPNAPVGVPLCTAHP